MPINSFCGINMHGSILGTYLRDQRIRFKWFYGYGNDAQFEEAFGITVRTLRALKAVAQSRMALVGGVAPGFRDLYYDARKLQVRFGVELVEVELPDVLSRMGKLSEIEVRLAADELTSGGTVVGVEEAQIQRMGRIYRSIHSYCQEQGFAAIGLSCWPLIQVEYDCVACSIIGQLNQAGLPTAGEGDLPGALGMYLLNVLNGQTSMLMDLSNVDTEDESVLLWHCGPAAKCWANKDGVTLCRESIGPRVLKQSMVNDMVFAPQPTTVIRVLDDGDAMFCFNSEIQDTKKASFLGSRGWFGKLQMQGQPMKAMDLLYTIMVNRVPHHYTVASGHLTYEIQELCNWLGMRYTAPLKYQPCMQNPDWMV